MNETNLAEVVLGAQSSLTSVNTTVIWIAVIQLVGTVLAAWTTILSRIILKDVNSDRTKRVLEVQSLNDSLTRLEKRNTLLAERGRADHEAAAEAVGTVGEAIGALSKPEVPTVDDAVVKIVDDAIVEERDRVDFDSTVTEPTHSSSTVRRVAVENADGKRLAAEDEASERRLNQTHEEFMTKTPGQLSPEVHATGTDTDTGTDTGTH